MSHTQHISQEASLVRDTLIELGLETPLVNSPLSQQQKYERIKSMMTEVVGTLGLDLTDDSLCETPHRIAKMYVYEVFSGLDYSNFPKLSVIENKMAVDEMVKVSDINLTSTCEHHFITIDGQAQVAYIPNKKIIGLSKINRIVRFFCPTTTSTGTTYPTSVSCVADITGNRRRGSFNHGNTLLCEVSRSHGRQCQYLDYSTGWGI